MHFKNLSFSIDRSVARVVLHRPPINALNREYVLELLSLAQYLNRRKEIWVIAVQSAMKIFSAGADLKERASLSAAQVVSFEKQIQKMVRTWLELPQPVLMRIDGSALGGGLEFALSGDMIVASEDAMFGFPEVIFSGRLVNLTRRLSI